MRIKIDFITNSSSTNFMLESKTSIELTDRNIPDQNYYKNLIYQIDRDEGDGVHPCKSFVCEIKNNGNNLSIEISGYFSENYSVKKREVISTGRNLQYVEKCLNKIDKEIKLPDEFEINFQQTVECQGDGWDGGDYSFAGQGYIFEGSSALANDKLTLNVNFPCSRSNKGKIQIAIPKFLMKLGN
jgi:hypothetical protein